MSRRIILLNGAMILLVIYVIILTFHNSSRAEEVGEVELTNRIDINHYDEGTVTFEELLRLDRHCADVGCGILVERADKLNIFNYRNNLSKHLGSDLSVVKGTDLATEFRASGPFKTKLIIDDYGLVIGVHAKEI